MGHNSISKDQLVKDEPYYICNKHKVVTAGKSRCDVGVTLREMCSLSDPYYERDDAVKQLEQHNSG